MRNQVRLGSSLCWALAWLHALAGPAVYLSWQSSLAWWGGMVLVLPLIALAEWRRERKDFYGSSPADVGAWSSPEHPGA